MFPCPIMWKWQVESENGKWQKVRILWYALKNFKMQENIGVFNWHALRYTYVHSNVLSSPGGDRLEASMVIFQLSIFMLISLSSNLYFLTLHLWMPVRTCEFISYVIPWIAFTRSSLWWWWWWFKKLELFPFTLMIHLSIAAFKIWCGSVLHFVCWIN